MKKEHEMVGHLEITLNENDFEWEPGLGEECIPTGPLQGDVPTLPAVSTVLCMDTADWEDQAA